MLVAAGLLGVGSVLSGRTVAAVMHAGCAARAGVPRAPVLGTVPRRALPPWLPRVAPAGGAMVGWLVAGIPGAVAGGIGGLAAPGMVRRRRAATRAALLEDQLAEAVSSLAAGLRAGLSLTRAIAFAAAEAEEPLASSFAHVTDRTDLGVPLDRALTAWASATRSADARLLTGVLALHRRTGGELPAVLDGVSVTLRERRAAAREVRALTAQARLSGAILGLLPIGFFLFLSVTSRDDVVAAFHSTAGIAAIAVGLVMQGLAFVWIRLLLRVEA
jgi:tight adherence protein B